MKLMLMLTSLGEFADCLLGGPVQLLFTFDVSGNLQQIYDANARGSPRIACQRRHFLTEPRGTVCLSVASSAVSGAVTYQWCISGAPLAGQCNDTASKMLRKTVGDLRGRGRARGGIIVSAGSCLCRVAQVGNAQESCCHRLAHAHRVSSQSSGRKEGPQCFAEACILARYHGESEVRSSEATSLLPGTTLSNTGMEARIS